MRGVTSGVPAATGKLSSCNGVVGRAFLQKIECLLRCGASPDSPHTPPECTALSRATKQGTGGRTRCVGRASKCLGPLQ
eukprot:scaffold67710_cov20-Tisochrysis_lutea.AAC.2